MQRLIVGLCKVLRATRVKHFGESETLLFVIWRQLHPLVSWKYCSCFESCPSHLHMYAHVQLLCFASSFNRIWAYPPANTLEEPWATPSLSGIAAGLVLWVCTCISALHKATSWMLCPVVLMATWYLVQWTNKTQDFRINTILVHGCTCCQKFYFSLSSNASSCQIILHSCIFNVTELTCIFCKSSA